MIRSGAGAGLKPVCAAHQSERRSKTIWRDDVATSLYAPVPTGQPLARSKLVNVLGSCDFQMCSGSITMWFSWPSARFSWKKRGFGLVMLMTAVKLSGVSTFFRYSLKIVEYCSSGELSRSISSVYLTSFEPNGSPSDHVMPLRSLAVIAVKASL